MIHLMDPDLKLLHDRGKVLNSGRNIVIFADIAVLTSGCYDIEYLNAFIVFIKKHQYIGSNHY